MERMKRLSQKINWKVIHFSVYFEILISYFMPFQRIDEFQYRVGFPFPFLSIYDKPIIHRNLFLSVHIDGLRLVANLAVVYLVTVLLLKLYEKNRK